MKKLPAKLGSKLTSLMWRFLAAYGRIKYRHLLPIYRAFGLLPNQRRARGTIKLPLTIRSTQALARALGPDPLKSATGSDQLRTVITRVNERKGAVVFLPSVIGWQIANMQRTHHLAREFARQGYVAIFDSSNSYDDVNGFKEIEPNLFLFRGPEKVLTEIPNPILWALTYNFDRRDAYDASARVVYDWVDELEVFHFDRAFLEKTHARGLDEATLVVSVARRLHEQAVAIRPDAIYLPNAVEYEHFAAESIPFLEDSDLDPAWLSGKPVAGYYGAIAEWFDYDLLDAVARLRPDWNFLLIGPPIDGSVREQGQAMLKRSNVRWIGQREYRKIPGYLQLFNVAMIPFSVNSITAATSPLKLYEYFAGGKPVVTTPMPECQAFAEVQIARNVEDFSRALDIANAQGKDPCFRERLRSLGRENSWPVRVQSVLRHLESRATPLSNGRSANSGPLGLKSS